MLAPGWDETRVVQDLRKPGGRGRSWVVGIRPSGGYAAQQPNALWRRGPFPLSTMLNGGHGYLRRCSDRHLCAAVAALARQWELGQGIQPAEVKEVI